MEHKISNQKKRMKALREILAQKNADTAIIWEPDNQYYLTGLRAEIYSRPLVLWVYPDRTEFIVPALEEVHAKKKAEVDKLHVYYETYFNSHLDTDYLQPFHRLMDTLPKVQLLHWKWLLYQLKYILYSKRKTLRQWILHRT